MYYEEQEVNGILCFKTSPKGEWMVLTVEMLQQKRVKEVEQKLTDLKGKADCFDYFLNPHSFFKYRSSAPNICLSNLIECSLLISLFSYRNGYKVLTTRILIKAVSNLINSIRHPFYKIHFVNLSGIK